ncbi:MAG: hypothetical protein AB2989_06915 [Candidatus Symbiodolus clandestinus]
MPLVIDALNMAKNRLHLSATSLVHSDQGCSYANFYQKKSKIKEWFAQQVVQNVALVLLLQHLGVICRNNLASGAPSTRNLMTGR